jgi:DNA-binding MarR family transcriptional regulator
MEENAQMLPLVDLIRELSNEIIQVQRWAAEQSGLNHTDLMGLYFIRNADGTATPTQLAQHLGLTSGATAILLNRLDARGFVVRSPHPTDRRGVLLSLGPAAKADSFLNVRKRLNSLNAKVIDALEPKDAAIVRRVMGELLTNTRDALREIRSQSPQTKPKTLP